MLTVDARLRAEFPDQLLLLQVHDELVFEPKWDGFRALVFRDGDELLIQSRDRKPLDRYFPELSAPLLANLPDELRFAGRDQAGRTRCVAATAHVLGAQRRALRTPIAPVIRVAAGSVTP